MRAAWRAGALAQAMLRAGGAGGIRSDVVRLAGVVVAVGHLAFATPAAAQSDLLVIQVVQRDGFGAPLPNAEVLPGGRAPSRLTDARGEVRLPWMGAPFRLVVRQIGFTPLDTTLTARPADGRVRLALATVAYRLPDVIAGSERGCPILASTAQRERTASILEQLKIGAQHFEAFRREYRWEVRSERRTGVLTSPTAANVTEVREETQDSRNWGAPYRRGRVLRHGGPVGFWADLLFVSALASSEFWDAHCFAAEESPPGEAEPTVRLRFTPRTTVKSPDWSGTAILDSATAELRRVDFELVNLRSTRPPRRLIGSTQFVRISPYVMVPRETGALWWTKLPTDTLPAWPHADQAQVLITQSLRWIGK
ncbi:MAG TPA: hypothetical protein VFX50_18545, partial [Gemmatimonadales bacterium]|nr:hypothetical protein [Gemmatimonadales bacterium]